MMISSKTKFNTARIVAICCLFALCVASILGAVLPNDNAEAKYGDANANLVQYWTYSSFLYYASFVSSGNGMGTGMYISQFAIYNDTGATVYFKTIKDNFSEYYNGSPTWGTVEDHDVAIEPGELHYFDYANSGKYFFTSYGYSLPISKLAPGVFNGYYFATDQPINFVNDTGRDVYVKYTQDATTGGYTFDFSETQESGFVSIDTYNYSGATPYGDFLFDYDQRVKHADDNRVWMSLKNTDAWITIGSNPFLDVPTSGCAKRYNKANGDVVPLINFEWNYDEATDTITINCDDAPRENREFFGSYVEFVNFLAEYKQEGTTVNLNISKRSDYIPSLVMQFANVVDKTDTSGASINIVDYLTNNDATPLRQGSTLQAIPSGYTGENKTFVSWYNDDVYDLFTSLKDSKWNDGEYIFDKGFTPMDTPDPDTNSSAKAIGCGSLSISGNWAYTYYRTTSMTASYYEFDSDNQTLNLLATDTEAIAEPISVEKNAENLTASVVVGEEVSFCTILSRAGVPYAGAVYAHDIVQDGTSSFTYELSEYEPPYGGVFYKVTINGTGNDTITFDYTNEIPDNVGDMTMMMGYMYDPIPHCKITLYPIAPVVAEATCHSITIKNADIRYDYYVGTTMMHPEKDGDDLVFEDLIGGVQYPIRMVLTGTLNKANYSFYATTDHIFGDAVDCKDGKCHEYECEVCGFKQSEYHVFNAQHICECGFEDPTIYTKGSCHTITITPREGYTYTVDGASVTESDGKLVFDNLALGVHTVTVVGNADDSFSYQITLKHKGAGDEVDHYDETKHYLKCSGCGEVLTKGEAHRYDANRVCTVCGYEKPSFRIDASFTKGISDMTSTDLDDDEKNYVSPECIPGGTLFTVYYYVTNNVGNVWEATLFPKYDSDNFVIEDINGSSYWDVYWDIDEMTEALYEGEFAGIEVYSKAEGESRTGFMFSITYRALDRIMDLGRYEFGLVEGKNRIGVGWDDETETYVYDDTILDAKGSVSALIRTTIHPEIWFYNGDEPFETTETLEGNAFTYDGEPLSLSTVDRSFFDDADVMFVLYAYDNVVFNAVKDGAEVKFYKYDSTNTDGNFKGEEIDGTPKNAGDYVVEYVLKNNDYVSDFDVCTPVRIDKVKISQMLKYVVWERNATGGVGTRALNSINGLRSMPANNALNGSTSAGEDLSFLTFDNFSYNCVYDFDLANVNEVLDVKVEWYRFTGKALGASSSPDAKIFTYENGKTLQGEGDHALESTAVVIAPTNGHIYFYNSGLYRITVSLKEEYVGNYAWDKDDTSWYNAERNALLDKLTGEEMLNGDELYYYVGISKSKLYWNEMGSVVYNGEAQLQSSASSFIKSTTYPSHASYFYVPKKFGANNYADLIDVTTTSASGYVDVGDYSVTVKLKDGSSTVATGEYDATTQANYDDDYDRYFCFVSNTPKYYPDGLALTMKIEPKTVYVSGGTAEQDYLGEKNTSGIATALATLKFTDESGETVLTESPLYDRDGIVTDVTTGKAYATNESTTEITYAAENAGTYVLKADFTVNEEAEGYVAGSKGLANYNFVFSSEYVINKIASPSIFYTTDKTYDGTTFAQGTGYASDEVTDGQYWAYVGDGATANDGTVKYYYITIPEGSGDPVWTEITRETVEEEIVCNMEFVNVGTYTLGVKITGATNYEDWQDTKTVKITPKAITWTYLYGTSSGVSDDATATAVGLVGNDNISTLFSSNKPITSYSNYLSANDNDKVSYLFDPQLVTLNENEIPTSTFTFADEDINPNYTVADLVFRKVVKIIFEDHSEDHVLSEIASGTPWLTKAETKNCGTTTDCTVTYRYNYVFVDEDGDVTFDCNLFGRRATQMATDLPLDRYTFAGWSYNGTPVADETAVAITGDEEVDTYTFRAIWTCNGVYVTYKYRYVHQTEADANTKTYSTYSFTVENETATYKTLAIGASVELTLSFANANWNNWFVSDGWKDEDGNLVTVAPSKDITLYAEFDFDVSKLGDVDGDGNLTSNQDVVFMRRYTVSYELGEVEYSQYDVIASLFYNATDSYETITATNGDYQRLFFNDRADTNGDGIINLSDIVILRMALTTGYDYEELESEGRVIETVEADTVEELVAGLNAGKKVILTADITDTEVAINITNATFAMIDLGTHNLTLAGLTLCGGNTNTYVAIIGSTGASVTLGEGATFKCEAPRGTVAVTGVVVTCGTTQVIPEPAPAPSGD